MQFLPIKMWQGYGKSLCQFLPAIFLHFSEVQTHELGPEQQAESAKGN